VKIYTYIYEERERKRERERERGREGEREGGEYIEKGREKEVAQERCPLRRLHPPSRG
jgi:hypothetical protein